MSREAPPGQAATAGGWAASTLAASREVPLAANFGAGIDEPGRADAVLADYARSACIEVGQDCGPVLGTGPLHRLGVAQLLEAYRQGDTTPQAVLQGLSGRVAVDTSGAVLRLIEGAALSAQDSATRWREGRARPLEGVPFGVKDIIDVAATEVTCGSLLTGARKAADDAACVARLRAAGAIPFAMLATSEFACGLAANRRFGPVANPRDPSRWTGGSSTGSAAALAGDLVPLALGTDTAGSIRIPAAFCGVTGFKPSRGLVPRTGVACLSWTLDHVGPMARSAADLALALRVLAGPDGRDPLCPPISTAAPASTSLAGVRIGVPVRWFTERCDRAVLDAWRQALAVFEALGAVLCAFDCGDLGRASEEAWMILYAELASCHEIHADRFELFDAGMQDRIARGRAMSAADYLRALRRRSLLQARMLRAMAGIDLLVTPGAGAEAATLDDLTVSIDGVRAPMYEIAARNTMIFNCTGMPALMLPSGRGADGLPLSIQIVTHPFQDGLCLAAGAAFQASTSHHLQRCTVSSAPTTRPGACDPNEPPNSGAGMTSAR